MARITSESPIDILSAQGATGAGTAVNVQDFRHITVVVSSANTADLTVHAQGAIAATAPTWTSAAALANEWSYIGMYDYEDATFKDGDTGIVFAGADDTAIYTINTDGLKWLNFRVSAWVAGDVTVRAYAFTNG